MSESQNHRAWGAFPSPLPDLRAPRRRRKRKVRATGSGNGGRSSVHDDTCNSYTRTVLVGSTASIGQRYLPAGRKAERSRPLVTRRRLCYVTVQCSAGPARGLAACPLHTQRGGRSRSSSVPRHPSPAQSRHGHARTAVELLIPSCRARHSSDRSACCLSAGWLPPIFAWFVPRRLGRLPGASSRYVQPLSVTLRPRPRQFRNILLRQA